MVKVSAIQMQMSENRDANVKKAESLVRKSHANGAQIILLPELFSSLYFCKDMDEKYFSLANELKNNSLIEHFSHIAKELGVVILVSYFEKNGNNYFNSLVVVDASGEVMDNYRKTHIPDGPGYEENFTLNRVIPALKYMTPNMEKLVQESVGISGFARVQGL